MSAQQWELDEARAVIGQRNAEILRQNAELRMAAAEIERLTALLNTPEVEDFDKAVPPFKDGQMDKAKHHCISTAAALRNWHAAIRNGWSFMRPGISGEKNAAAEPSRTGEDRRANTK